VKLSTSPRPGDEMKKRLISKLEADRAIYVDFEKTGRPDAPPSVSEAGRACQCRALGSW